MKTAVIFRRYPSGEVIALFPLEPGTLNPETCPAFIGGEGGGLFDDSTLPLVAIAETSPATPAQSAALEAELRAIGYDLRILKRIPANAYAKRAEALRNIR